MTRVRVAFLIVVAAFYFVRAPIAAVPAAAQTLPTCAAPAFSAPAGYDVARDDVASGTSIGSGDLNGDGTDDLVSVVPTDGVAVLLAAGDGTFGAPAYYPAPNPSIVTPSAHLLVTDFTGDGNADVALPIEPGLSSEPPAIAVLPGDGAGHLGHAVVTALGADVFNLGTADFNEDGIPDVAMLAYPGSVGTIEVRLGLGDGRFGVPSSHAVTGFPNGMALGDFNADGHVDIALAVASTTPSLSGHVEVRLGDGAGGFGAPGRPQEVGVQPHYIVHGDFNGDGQLDAATTNAGMSSDETDTISVAFGDGTGAFSGRTDHAVLHAPGALAAADVNGDGRQDLLVPDVLLAGVPPELKYLLVFVQDEGGAFGSPTRLVIGEEERSALLTVADFDADGRPDVAATYPSPPLDVRDRDLLVLHNLCGNVADLAVTVEDTPDPALAGRALTYTIQITNDGPDLAGAFVAVTLPPGLRQISAAVEGGTCIPDDRVEPIVGHTVHCSLDVAPGSAHIFEVVVHPQRGGTVEAAVVVDAGAFDPALSNNTATLTTVVRMPGGTGFRVRLGAAGPTMSWNTGDAQAGYFIGRLVDGVRTVLPATGNPLPAGATSFVDTAPVPGKANCYVVTPIDSTGASLGVSDLLCAIPGTGGGNAPRNFSIGLHGTSVAFLAWSPPGGQTGYLLRARFVGGGGADGELPAGATSYPALTLGSPICFSLSALIGSTTIGTAPTLCAIPGVNTLPR